MIYRIEWEPSVCSVSDERHYAPGVLFRVIHRDGAVHDFEVAEPETCGWPTEDWIAAFGEPSPLELRFWTGEIAAVWRDREVRRSGRLDYGISFGGWPVRL